jgi:peptide-methionine (S)-S-oxide reductase
MTRNKFIFTICLLLQTIVMASCGQGVSKNQEALKPIASSKMENNNKTDSTEVAILGGGCFWCVEAQYLALEGVITVESGYSGGNNSNPTYKEVCTGMTNHAEVVRITYDPRVLSFEDVLYAFWQSHDPTTLNRQGADEGTQYRSVIFCTNAQQKTIAEDYIKRLNSEKAFDNPVVTEVSPLDKFYVAEDYHQNYYNNNKSQGYCMMVVGPKLEKFKKVFKDKLKK